MSKGIVNRRDKFLWDNSAKPSITDAKGTVIKSTATVKNLGVYYYAGMGEWYINTDYSDAIVEGDVYKMSVISGFTPIPTQSTMYLSNPDTGAICTIDLTQCTDSSNGVYIKVTSVSGDESTAVYLPGGSGSIEYTELEIGSGIKVEDGKLATISPTIATPSADDTGKMLVATNGNYVLQHPNFGNALDLDGQNLSLMNGNIALSTVSLGGTKIPAYSSADSGKVLAVDANGELIWKTLS